MIVKLNQKLKELLIEVVAKHRPEMQRLITSETFEVSDSELDELFDIVGNEFMETGLEKNDEPNERGLRLEDLIGRLSKKLNGAA